MNLKNYTSTVSAEKSIATIERMLVDIGAKNINREYKDKRLAGIKFLIDIGNNTVAFALPAKEDKVFEIMWREVKRPHSGTRDAILEQANRTAWKIVSDWTAIQISMIQLEQAEILQIFLPYALMSTGETFYHSLKSNGMKMLTQ